MAVLQLWIQNKLRRDKVLRTSFSDITISKSLMDCEKEVKTRIEEEFRRQESTQ